MAQEFILVSVPRSDIRDQRKDWVLQIVGLVDAAGQTEMTGRYPAATLVSREDGDDYWSVEVCQRDSRDATGFRTNSFDCGGFGTDGAPFVLRYDVPDSIVLVATEDIGVFTELCLSAGIGVQHLT